MKTILAFFLFTLTALAQPTFITFVTRTQFTVGVTACVANLGLVTCDNTGLTPPAAVGIVTSSALNTNGRNYTTTVQINAVDDAPVPFGTLCNSGDLVGDVDGTGTLGDLGQPATAVGPAAYVGLCLGNDVTLTKMFVAVQPGYVK